MANSAVQCLSFSGIVYTEITHIFSSYLFQIPVSIHAPKHGHIRGASTFLGKKGEGSRSCLLWQRWLQKRYQRESSFPYPEGMHFCFHLLLEHSSSDACHCPDPGHREGREMLLDHFRGMPVASNYDQLEKAFHFEEHMESIRKGEPSAMLVGMKI